MIEAVSIEIKFENRQPANGQNIEKDITENRNGNPVIIVPALVAKPTTMIRSTVVLITSPTLLSILLLPMTTLMIANAQKPRRDESYPPPQFLERFRIIHDVCVEKTGVTEAAIKEFSDGEIHEDPALKCYMNCLFHEVNAVDSEGEMHYETLKRLIPADLSDFISKLIDGCESHVPKGATQCDRAWSWHVCWKEMDPTHYFLP